MRERLIELLDVNCGYVDEVKAETLADYLLKNNVVVLPCKVGDTLWTTYGGSLSNYEVKDIVINDFCWAKLFNEGYVAEHKFLMSCLSFDLDKTVFLTREEAEKALKERNND